ncbi:nucleolin [Folsomia candida]|uniref:Uncharacterized protein n=1 Tax=Folsomia candida TaxID=158441 RepID=A0A226CZP8_FOLCA|nr:nucleolin [Folsomia candida]OXA37957.1 hypothetical protein Fcan01_27288 [Folsomia candida]
MTMSPDEEQEIALGRPTKFKPDWPPQPSQTPLPKVFSKCSEKFKKVSWPPKDDESQPVDQPVSLVQLQDEMQMNDERWKPCGTYKAAPTIYAEQPAQLNEDVWPPPEGIDTSERVIHDASRPKRAIRDYTVFFSKNKAPEGGKSYKVPPGTLHVVAERGVLSFENVDIGKGTLAEVGPDGQPFKPGQQQQQQQPPPKGPQAPNRNAQQQQPARRPVPAAAPPPQESDEEEEEEEEEEDSEASL